MADFCLECTFNIFPELLPTGENDLAGLCEPDEKVWAICEGCGPVWFDFTGQRVTTPKAPTVAAGNIYSGERGARGPCSPIPPSWRARRATCSTATRFRECPA